MFLYALYALYAACRLLGLLALLGGASCSLCLSHPYVIQLLAKLAPAGLPAAPQVVLGAVTCVLCVAASLALYRFVETPLQQDLTSRRLVAS